MSGNTAHERHQAACAKSAVARMYEKFCTFLRVEVLSNNERQFGARKSLEHLDKVRSELSAATGRYAGFVAECMDVHVEFPLFQRLALPIPVGEADAEGKFKTKIPGIKIHDTRMIRLMEVLLHAGTRIHAWKTAQMHRAVLEASGLKPDEYTLNQLRYDLRKLRAHGLAERDGKRYAYRLAEKGTKEPPNNNLTTKMQNSSTMILGRFGRCG